VWALLAFRRRSPASGGVSTPKWLDRVERTHWLVAVAVGAVMLSYALSLVSPSSWSYAACPTWSPEGMKSAESHDAAGSRVAHTRRESEDLLYGSPRGAGWATRGPAAIAEAKEWSMSTNQTEASSSARRRKTRKVQHLTVGERAAHGKAARADLPRRIHGEWEPASNRPDPVELLEEQARTRVPELVPIRYGRMLVSPFTFFRGAAYLMASDLAGGPRSGLHAQLCGDAHLSNFGVFASPDRRLVFSVNDFDETLPGPFEWDLKRLVASFAVAGRDRGFDDKTRARINRSVSRAYREAMREFAATRNLDVWYARIDIEEMVQQFQAQASAEQKKRLAKNLAKTRTKDSLAAFGKLTKLVDGEPRIVGNPPLIVPLRELVSPGEEERVVDALQSLIRSYRRTLHGGRRTLLERFRFADAARKVVGVGSVGTRAWIVLMLGRDNDDPLFLQAKEAQSSVLEPFLGQSEFAHHGQRVVEGQWLMQAASDIMLGWVRATGVDGVERDFYVRQLWDAKGSAVVEVMDPRAMTFYAQICGSTLAKAHARSGDAIAIAAYLGSSDAFDRALSAFAESYADQNERDYNALTKAVESGRVDEASGL
jgi:uncharacterized protein (DUF2252 family)